jgi:hypothetical protein
MKRLPLCVILTLSMASPTLATAKKLAAPDLVQEMLGDVGVMANAEDERCNVVLFETEVKHGYRIQVDEGCAAAFPVMAKIEAWRVYRDATMSFADATGTDLVNFKKGKGYKRFPVKKVDGIEFIWSAQEVAE